MSAPDTQMDMQNLSMDLASGNYVDAGLDAVGIAIPGVPAVEAKGAKELGCKAVTYGVKKYKELKKAVKGTGLEVHHLIEKRFAQKMELKAREMLAVAVTKAEHLDLKNKWRKAISYGEGTLNATEEEIKQAARMIYEGYSDILRALGLD